MGSVPAYLQNVVLVPFTDWGMAWDRDLSLDDLAGSVGASLVFAFRLGYGERIDLFFSMRAGSIPTWASICSGCWWRGVSGGGGRRGPGAPGRSDHACRGAHLHGEHRLEPPQAIEGDVEGSCSTVIVALAATPRPRPRRRSRSASP